MTRQVNSDDERALEDTCSECGTAIPDENKSMNDADENVFECPDCGEIRTQETIASKAQKIADGDAEAEDFFGTDRRSREEIQESYDQMNEPIEVEIDDAITGPKGTCDDPDCDRTDGLQVTNVGTHLCPEHHADGEE